MFAFAGTGFGAVPADPRAMDARGTLRVLVIRATWGPQPEPGGVQPTTRAALADTAAFFARSSFGRLHLDITPWLPTYTGPTCPGTLSGDRIGIIGPTDRSVFGTFGVLAQDAAAAAGYDLASYRRFVYLLPENACRPGGIGSGREVLLTTEAEVVNTIGLVHELGHTFGLPHATRSRCALGCAVAEYGDPFSPMGHGAHDFSASEKFQLGWIGSPQNAARGGTYSIGSIERPTALPQALVIPTAAGEYWLEHRRDTLEGLLVRVVRPNDNRNPRFLRSIFLATAAERFAAPGVFTVRRVKLDDTALGLRFAWTDRTRPTPPRLRIVPTRIQPSEPLWLSWASSRDRGSGIAFYRVLVDGVESARVSKTYAVVPDLSRGGHRVSVEAVVRANNRSRRETARVAVR